MRHSAVEMDPDTPSHLWRLSAEGRQRSLELALRLIPTNPGVVVTSREPKAVETGQILADALAVGCEIGRDLHEHDRQGVAFFDTREAFEAAVIDFFAHPHTLRLGRETAEAALARFDAAVKQALATHPEGDLIIVAHGTVITLFVCRYNPKVDPILFWRSLEMPDRFTLSLPEYTLQD